MSSKYASKPPPGVVPDYVNPPRNTAVIRLEVIAPLLMGIAAIFVALRLYVRRFIVDKMEWDDFAISVSLVGHTNAVDVAWTDATPFSSASYSCHSGLRSNEYVSAVPQDPTRAPDADFWIRYTATRFGLGYHLYVLPLHEFSPGFLKWELALQEVYTAASLAVRVAIVLLVLRIVGPIKRYRILVYVLVFIIIVYHVAKAFAFLFGCVPIAMNWNITIKSGHCIDRFKLAVAFNALNVITDVLLWTIPVPVVWNLQMRMRHKIEVLSVFGVGLIIIAISVYRCVIQNTLVGVTDVTWFYPDVHLWACIELQVGIICGCMPPLKTLFPRILPASWFSQAPSEPHRLSHLGTYDKKGFSHLAESGPRSTNGTLTGDKASRRPSHPKVPDWYDVEPGLLAGTGGLKNNTGAFENTVVSLPPNERTHSALNRELDARGIPSPDRGDAQAIHKQQDFEVTHEAMREGGVGGGYETPMVL